MSHKSCDMGVMYMGIGTSGRIVIEVEPNVKRELYGLLATEGLSLKHWFLRNAMAYIEGSRQLPLSLGEAPVRAGGQTESEGT
jgi:hypothetical protein